MSNECVFSIFNPFPPQDVTDAHQETHMPGMPCLLADAQFTAGPAPSPAPCPGPDPRQRTLCPRCLSARPRPARPGVRWSLTGCPAALRDAEGRGLTLTHGPGEEGAVVMETVAMGTDGPPLTTAFLMSVCVQSAAARGDATDLRRLLLLVAANAQNAVWVSPGVCAFVCVCVCVSMHVCFCMVVCMCVCVCVCLFMSMCVFICMRPIAIKLIVCLCTPTKQCMCMDLQRQIKTGSKALCTPAALYPDSCNTSL